MGYWVYLLRCGDGSLYTGTTDNIARRLHAHQSGRGAKYTRSHLPVELVYQLELPDRSTALRREAAIKKLPRSKKLELVTTDQKKAGGTHMRRKDRETTPEFAWGIVDQCEYAFLAMTGEDGSPYGIPITIARKEHSIYFHSAMDGRKVRCLRLHPQVCLTCVGDTHIQEEQFTTQYESAVVLGSAAEVRDPDEKAEALRLICQRHTPGAMNLFEQAIRQSLDRTAIFRIDVSEISGKCNK